jgi:hypothetical protein
MRPRTRIPIEEPTRSEFKNFDRLMGTLLKAKPMKKPPKAERPATDQATARERRLPRP